MEAFGIIDEIRTYCEDNNIVFYYGTDGYNNAVADRVKYEEGRLIMLVFINPAPTITNSRITANRYRGEIALGRKREATTTSSLDETFIQKYDNRLRALATQLVNAIGGIACAGEYSVDSLEMTIKVNHYDLNADFVAGQVTLSE